MPIYRLGSNSLAYAPGLIAWAINAYAFPRDRGVILRVVIDTWPSLPEEAARGLLSGEQAFKIEDDTILIDVAETDVPDATSATAHSKVEGGQ